MYGSFCRFRISEEFSDFALKNGFRRNSIIVDQFRQNWLLNACPSKVKKMSADFGGIARNFGGIARNFGGITRTQHWLQISTAHPISAEFKILGMFICFFGRIFRIQRFLCWYVISAEVPKKDSPGMGRSFDPIPSGQIMIFPGWWYTYPSEKYEFVSWDYEIPNICNVRPPRYLSWFITPITMVYMITMVYGSNLPRYVLMG